MFRKCMSLFLGLLMVLSMTGAVAETAVTVTDMTGREITLTEPATRIVALTASDCEILYALGAGDLLVGRGEYCDYPEAVLALPAVQSGAETNIEQIKALEPQVVLMATMAQTTEQVEALENAGIHVVVSDAQNIEGIYQAIEMIGALVGKTAEAETLTASMKDTFAAVSEASVETGKTVYFEVSPLQWGLWTAGKGTFMDELAGMCGLTNVFADVDGWASISEEQVLARNPDYIVTTTMYFGEGPTPVEEITSRPGWENLKAVTSGQVFNADYNEITRPGPRLMNAVQSLFDFVQEHEASLEPAA
ncbi:MAG: ABC transporter substrate-binding protein [Clostridiales bacterium]|nr:ABC transporter substrate-binding protein [Clostridiales bacterium]